MNVVNLLDKEISTFNTRVIGYNSKITKYAFLINDNSKINLSDTK